jgi:hypothetical protein
LEAEPDKPLGVKWDVGKWVERGIGMIRDTYRKGRKTPDERSRSPGFRDVL